MSLNRVLPEQSKLVMLALKVHHGKLSLGVRMMLEDACCGRLLGAKSALYIMDAVQSLL